MTEGTRRPAAPPKGYVDAFGEDKDDVEVTPFVVKAKTSSRASATDGKRRSAARLYAMGK